MKLGISCARVSFIDVKCFSFLPTLQAWSQYMPLLLLHVLVSCTPVVVPSSDDSSPQTIFKSSKAWTEKEKGGCSRVAATLTDYWGCNVMETVTFTRIILKRSIYVAGRTTMRVWSWNWSDTPKCRFEY